MNRGKVSRGQRDKGRVIAVGGVIFRSDFECGNIENARIVAPNTFLIDLER